MRERGWNLAELEERGRYLVFDAEETATEVMRGSIVDSDAIAGMDAALQSARTASGASHLTIVGEIASVLWRRGSPDAALEVERLWTELTRALPILTICTYPTPTDAFDHDLAPGVLSGICAHHSVISHAGDWRA